MAYAILRFAKHKGGASKALSAHHERTKEIYARIQISTRNAQSRIFIWSRRVGATSRRSGTGSG